MQICSVFSCDRPVLAVGLCAAHRYRLRKFGSVMADVPIAAKASNGELLKFIRDHRDYDGRDCLIWPYGKSPSGRGVVRFRGVQTSAPRVMCIEAHGEPPTPEHEAAHNCGMGHEGCIHPGHLRWATAVENRSDMHAHGTSLVGDRHPMSVLDKGAVREIRRSFDRRRDTYSSVADRYGVDSTTIGKIIRHETWSHL